MLDPEKGNIFSADIEVNLGARERSVLSAQVQQEGFDILQTLMEDVIRNLNSKLINTDPSDPFYEKIVKNRHRVAYAAGRFYIDLMARIKEECQIAQYNAAKLGTAENPENPSAPDFN